MVKTGKRSARKGVMASILLLLALARRKMVVRQVGDGLRVGWKQSGLAESKLLVGKEASCSVGGGEWNSAELPPHWGDAAAKWLQIEAARPPTGQHP